jgi:hypothetical protein
MALPEGRLEAAQGLAGTHVGKTQVWATPDHIPHMSEECRAVVGEFELATSFLFGDAPYHPVEDGLKLHAKEALPELHSWKGATAVVEKGGRFYRWVR